MPLCSDIVGIEPMEGDVLKMVGIEPMEGDVWKMVRAVTNEEHRARLGSLGCSRNLGGATSGYDLTHQVLENDSQNDCQPKPVQQQRVDTPVHFAE